MDFLPDYPAYLSRGETGLRFIQTHHYYIYRVVPERADFLASNRKTVYVVIHLIARLRIQ